MLKAIFLLIKHLTSTVKTSKNIYNYMLFLLLLIEKQIDQGGKERFSRSSPGKGEIRMWVCPVVSIGL